MSLPSKRYSHWKPNYIVSKIKLRIFQLLEKDSPWLVREATERLSHHLSPDSTCLEWGSGRSTLWFAERCGHITSVEHNPEWFEKVKQMTAASDNVTLHFRTSQPRSEYVGVVNEFRPESIDCCLVDAKCRAHCAIAAVPKIKPGGLLVIDNIDRYIPTPAATPSRRTDYHDPLWREFHQEAVKGWPEAMFSNGVWSTAIWTKPMAASPAGDTS